MASGSASILRRLAVGVYGLLNPIPFGMFVAALIFDITYLRTGEVLWNKAAAWLIPLALIIAIIPRFINLGRVWASQRAIATGFDKLDFWLNLVAIIAAIFNAFVHSRDAYASMPTGVWLSAVTVALLAIGNFLIAAQAASAQARP